MVISLQHPENLSRCINNWVKGTTGNCGLTKKHHVHTSAALTSTAATTSFAKGTKLKLSENVEKDIELTKRHYLFTDCPKGRSVIS